MDNLNLATLATPRYVLAKFIPDLARMEPRNIGVIVWSKDGIAARFVAEKPQSLGEVDGRYVPGSIEKVLPGYKQWVKFWRAELCKETIKPAYGGDPVKADSPKFLDALIDSTRGNFVLEEGGMLLDELCADTVPSDFADYLYKTLVEEPGSDEAKDANLQVVAENVLSKSKIKTNPNFHPDYVLECKIGKVVDRQKFSYAYQNGSLTVLQKVSLPRNIIRMQTNVHSAAWMFEQSTKAKHIDKEHGCTLVYVTPEQQADSNVSSALNLLDSVSSVYNLYEDEDRLLSKLQKLQTSR